MATCRVGGDAIEHCKSKKVPPPPTPPHRSQELAGGGERRGPALLTRRVGHLMRRDRLLIRSIQLGLFASVFAAWYLASQAGVRRLLLPPPELVWREMQGLWMSGRLWSAAVVTLNEIWQAYSIAVIAGVAVVLLVSRSRALVRIFEPVLAGMFAVPLTLFFPLFVVFFGIGPESKVAYAATQCFFSIALNTIAGFANVDELYLRASRAMGASSLAQFRYIYLPAALPVTVTGLRIGFFICIAAVLGA